MRGNKRTSECSLLLLRKSSAYFGIRAAPAPCAVLSSNGDAERAATPEDDALRALEIFDMGAVTRDMMKMKFCNGSRSNWKKYRMIAGRGEGKTKECCYL